MIGGKQPVTDLYKLPLVHELIEPALKTVY